MSAARASLTGLLAAWIAVASPGCEHDGKAPGLSGPSDVSPSGSTVASRADTPPFSRRLVDVTARSGIRFRHVTGAFGDKLLPETLGSGVALLDFDGDTVLDIFFVNSGFWPGHAPQDTAPATCALYRGRGDGTFEDVSSASGADISLYGMGCAAADYDGDGDVDLYVTAVGDNVLLRNDGGRFRDVTGAAGVSGGHWTDRGGETHPEWSTGALWSDLDLDGDLDLFVANYVEWTPASDIFTTLDGTTKVFTTPDRYRGLPCRLFVNRGDGTFEDGTERAGIAARMGKALGVAQWDFDGNGHIDIVVANDTRPNFLFLNGPGLELRERGLELGIAYDAEGRARAGMGVDVAGLGPNGQPVVAIGNFSDEPMSLYRWVGEAGFVLTEERAGLAASTYTPLTFGVVFADLDLDGFEDLVVVNGHIEPEIARFRQTQTHAQTGQVFQGLPGVMFRDVSHAAGPGITRPRVGRGLARGDLDGDGDLDLVITTSGGEPALLRNDAATPASPTDGPHFLRVRLHGKGANTQALGARVRLEAGGATRTRVVRTGSSYLSQSEITLTFGLGETREVDRLEVTWPGGTTRSYDVSAVDRTIDIRQE